MSVMDPAAGAQPQPQPQTVPAGGAEPQRQPLDFQSAIDGMNDESEIASMLFAEPQVAPPTAAPVPSGNEPGDPPPADPQPESDPAAGTKPPQEPAEPAEPPAPQAASNLERISLKSLHPDDRLLIANAKEMVREGKAASFADAIMSLKGAGTQEPSPPAAAPAEPTPAPQPDPVPPDPASELQQLEQDLETLQAERDEAIENFDRPNEVRLTKEIEKLGRQIARQEAIAEIRNQQATVQQQSLQTTIEDIYVEYPESEDPKSFFSYRMTQELEAYEATHGPIARHPQQLRAIAGQVAAELGQARGTQQQSQPAAPVVQPRQKAQPIGTAAPGSAAAVRVSPDQLQKAIDNADEATLHAALFG